MSRSTDHMPKPAGVLPFPLVRELRTAVAHRFDAHGRWIPALLAETKNTMTTLDQVIETARDLYPEHFQ